VVIQEVDQSLAESFGLDRVAGALVGSVERGSPAEKAGIEPGDVILKFNGREIARSADLPPLVADLAPGSSAEVQLWREKKLRTLPLKVGEMKTARSETPTLPEAKGKLGLALRPLTADERSEADVGNGLVVEAVTDGPAARAGIRQGDVILSVNGEKVASVSQLRTLIEKGGKRLALQVMRDDQKLFVPINLG
jgi:serine protease Do